MNEDSIKDLQAAVLSRLLDDEWLAEVAVFSERKGNILDDVTQALGTMNVRSGKIGACIVVLAPSATIPKDAPENIPFEIRIAAHVLEEPLFNSGATGTGKDSLSIAKRVARLLHGFSIFGEINPLTPETPTILPIDNPAASRAYEVRFATTEARFDVLEKTCDVEVLVSGGEATLVSATPGAGIRYTIDGTLPSKNSALYTAPFAVTPPLTIKCCAFKSGEIGSNISGLTI